MVGTHDGNSADIHQRLAVGSHFEPFETTFVLGNHRLSFSREIHRKYLVATTEHDGVVVIPYRAEFALGCGCQALCLTAIGRHAIKFGVVFVLLHVGVAQGVEHCIAIGANGIFAHHAEAPHHLGGEPAIDNRHIGLADNICSLFRLTGGQAQ